MFCKSCGKQIEIDSIFCSYCGTKQSDNLRPITNSDKIISNQENTNYAKSFTQIEESINSVKNEPKLPKYDLTYKKDNSDAIIVGVILIIVTLILLAAPIKFETEEGYKQFNAFSAIISLIIRIFVTIWVVNIAKEQNRDTLGWGFFAFLFPAITLIVVATGRKLYSKSSSSETDVNQQNDKVSTKTNDSIQTVFRETLENKLLKIISKNTQTIGADVLIDDYPAPDGIYNYKSGSHRLIIENGKIKARYFLKRTHNVIIEQTNKNLAQKGDKVFLDTGLPAPTGKYGKWFTGKLVVEDGKFVRYE